MTTTTVSPPIPSPPLLHSRLVRISGALFYALSSFLIIMVNKYALYTWKFPSVATLALAQFCFTLLALEVLKRVGWVSFPSASMAAIKNVFPLPLLFVGNALSGLFGTKMLSLPMFTVLRRTNMVLTMLLESYVLHTRYSMRLKLSIAVMLLGSVLAALLDMQFDAQGYAATLLNNFFTSINGVVLKLKLNRMDHDASHNNTTTNNKMLQNTWGLMYLNSLCGTPLLLIGLLLLYPDTLVDAYHFEHWHRWEFQLLFLLSSAMGMVLQFSIFYCTRVNSALTTVVTGVLKNVVTSYAGMLDPRLGYTFHWLNFLGMNLSMLGGIWYAQIQFVQQSSDLAINSTTTTTSAATPATTTTTANTLPPLNSTNDQELLLVGKKPSLAL